MNQKLLVEGNEIPVNIYVERRTSVRASLVKKGLNIRLPLQLSLEEREQHIVRLKNWAENRIQKSQALQKKFYSKRYYSGLKIRVQEVDFELEIIPQDRKTYTGKLQGYRILILTPLHADEVEMSKIIPRIISNLMSKCFHKRVANRVHLINDKYYGKSINKIALKYTSSIWGSCAHNGNISLSSRLLKAPQDVMDYVIVHELAHRVHANHSASFWKEVARVMPNYREKELWLKKHGHLCDY